MGWIVWAVIGGLLVLFLLTLWAMLMAEEPMDLDEEWRCLQADAERKRRRRANRKA